MIQAIIAATIGTVFVGVAFRARSTGVRNWWAVLIGAGLVYAYALFGFLGVPLTGRA